MRFSPLCAILKSIWKGVDRVERKKLSGGVIVRRCLVVLLVTILLLVLALYGVMFVLAKGPSNYARELFVMSVRETSAVGFLANLYLSDEEIAEIEARRGQQDDLEETDTSLVQIGQGADAYGLVDDDGDGIILESLYRPG